LTNLLSARERPERRRRKKEQREFERERERDEERKDTWENEKAEVKSGRREEKHKR
jgi:hypothetical protein